MQVEFKVKHKGMLLEEPIQFSSGINILCGKNGSGKSRLIDAIKQQNITNVSNENGNINSQSILFITAQNMLAINSGQVLSQQSLDETYRNICQVYQRYLKEKKTNPNISIDRDVMDDHRGHSLQLDGKTFGTFIKETAKNHNKDIDNLTEQEIKSEKLPTRAHLNIQNEISFLCSSYLWLKRRNNQMEYYKDKGEENILVYNFEEKHGRAPWVIINEILKDELETNWYLEQSDRLSEDIKPVEFKTNDGDRKIEIQHLSDGEKTILWISCALIKHTLNRKSLDECQLILLDEPDAFLHPRMIHSFLSVIRKMSKELNCDVLMSTHSPTTVALAKGCNVYNVTPNKVTHVSQDFAIRDLLDGVNYIAVSPENRRIVYVEGYNDRIIYDRIFGCFTENNLISLGLTMQFIEAAPRTDEDYLLNKIKQHWKGASNEEAQLLADEINGQGSCSAVRGQVSAFRNKDNSTIFGIIDRDKNNKSKNGLIVLCDGDFYAMDNVVLNPLSVLVFLYQEYSQEMVFKNVFGKFKYTLMEILLSPEKLSNSAQNMYQHVFPKNDNEVVNIEYVDGNNYDIPKVWIDNYGHDLEKTLKLKFKFLDTHKFKKEGKLKDHITKLMCETYKGKYYPQSLLETFNKIE